MKKIIFLLVIFSLIIFLSLQPSQKPSSLSTNSISVVTQKPEFSPEESYEKENEDLRQRSSELSPDGTKLAFFQNKFTTKIEEIGDKDYISLMIEENGKSKKVFSGNYHLLNFDWLNNCEIAIYKDCGTECVGIQVVDINTRKVWKYFLGGGYSWSPDKKYAVGYHDSVQYGITIADKYGNEKLDIHRDYPEVRNHESNPYELFWSPDSSKLALFIKKERQEQYELIVYNSNNNFRINKQIDIKEVSYSEAKWLNNQNFSYKVSGKSQFLYF